MPVKSALVFIVSVLTACFSVYHIFAVSLGSARSSARFMNDAISESSGILLLDPMFWFWVVLAWVSAYLLIKNYIILSEFVARQ